MKPKAAPAAAPAATAAPALPQPLRDATAVLTSASGSQVYVLGVSHVSKVSCRQVEELIQLVRPDIVLVELCKERVPLLVNPDDPPPGLWYSSRLTVSGLPAGPGWPSSAQLVAAAGLKCSGGMPVTASEIEDDCVTLLSTGLFAAVMPAVKPPGPNAAPAFLLKGTNLQTVAPAGEIEFLVKERMLPKLTSLETSLDAGAKEASADGIERVMAAALQAAVEGASAVSCYLQAREGLLGLYPADVRESLEVVFEGAESGSARAVVCHVTPGQRPSVAGLEGTAVGGKGWGIQAFQRRAPKHSGAGLRLGASQQLDAAALEAALPTSDGTRDSRNAGTAAEPATRWRPWSDAERRQGDAAVPVGSSSSNGSSNSSSNPLSQWFARSLSQAYAGYQAKAGRQVGVPPGAAWQAALRAAAANGAQQVLLGDRPGHTTAQRLADAIWDNWAPFLLGSIPAAVASAIIMSSGLEEAPYGPLAAAAAAAVPLAVAAWPVAAPLVDIAKFAGLSAREIEETVRVKEPVQASQPDAPMIKLWGEDALLDWPGAVQPIINERDIYMARTLAAAANGVAQGLTPALIRTEGEGAAAGQQQQVLRYAMPEGGHPVVCPAGQGDGVYQPLPPGRTVVGVVGTAHVRGIIRAWAAAQENVDLSPFV
ncbi:hypothetical protein N2152v2_005206 [Parachlorella kessleri]